MKKFELHLRNEKKRFYDRFALLIFVLNALGILIALAYINQSDEPTRELILAAAGLILLTYLFFVAYNDKVTRYLRTFISVSFLLLLFWVLAGHVWLGLVNTALLFLYIIAQREMVIVINEEKVIYPSFPKKNISWDSLSNVILKDGLLTIDSRNNKIIQHYIQQKTPGINEKDFNEFCRQQLVTT